MNEAAVYAQTQRETMGYVVTDYLPLVKKIGLHLVARLPPGVELDDLLQVGLIGLIQARESYDPSQGASFSTYASIRIKGAMLDEVRRNDWVPRAVQQKMKQVSGAIKQIESRLGRPATDAEIAEELGVSLGEYHQTAHELACCRMTPLEDPDVEEGGENGDPFSRLEEDGFRESLSVAIQSLPEKEQLVMSLYYSEELNLKEIGEVLEVSESRVSQIHGQALVRIRTRLSGWIR